MGSTFLKGQQDKVNGGWPEHHDQPGGMTSLCTLALLTAGESPTSPEMQAALTYLRNLPTPEATYATALRIMVLAAAGPEKDLAIIARDARWLEEAQLKTGEDAGTWGYHADNGQGDQSNTQFALLGLYEAERVGVAIDAEVWQRLLDYFRKTQRDDGSWTYKEESQPLPSSGSMTCAGIGSLLICADRAGDSETMITEDGGVRCCGLQEQDDRVERGIAWLGRHGLSTNPGMGVWHYYYLYGIERVGRLSGRRFLGEHDWYREGATLLLTRQDPLNGQWRGTGPLETNPVLGTAFALLFLSKGRQPVLISQLDWEPTGARDDWNRHPAGLRNLTRQVEEKWHKELTWQTIRLKHAALEDLMQSPVLYLRGTQALELTADQKAELKEYVNQGGFIFAEACDGSGCDGAAFDKSFRA